VPELPEVETVARQLDPLVVGRRIRRVEILDEKLDGLDTGALVGCRIARVRRVGKQVVFDLLPPRARRVHRYLVVHLRMTGRLLWYGQRTDELPRRRAVLELDRGLVVFSDTRRFGTLTLCHDEGELTPVGHEPLSSELTAGRLAALLDGARQEIKAWLLRQDRLVGLGNIYASEILHAAGIDPRRQAATLSRAEIGRLLRATRRILAQAIEHCGTTFSDFQDARGETGGFVRFLKVYRHEGERCRRCGDTIARIVQQQRSTFFCPGCQD
jgi:formamidopyrimidine-DNA glycosylase